MGMRIVESEVLYQGKLRGIRDVIELDDGRRFKHETIEHPGAVVILPILPDGRIAFIEQYRHSVRASILELPAGTLEASEDPTACAQRELMEEIGMASRDILALGTLYPAPGFCSEVQHIFVARGLYPSKATPDDDEAITLVPLSVEEAEEAARTGRLSDAKSLALILRARLNGLI
jgi:ADP-ribose pyrophosphatase